MICSDDLVDKRKEAHAGNDHFVIHIALIFCCLPKQIYYMTVSQKVCELPNSRVWWLAEIHVEVIAPHLDRHLDW